ncbi:MAG TPA: hypothetical protein PKD68_01050 [Candidatus Saccharibacteria bacterium]|nr:hypothetical protein [Candidatus Saccharibacteria bacterium]
MSIHAKYWLSLVATLLSGVAVVKFYGPVFNGIQEAGVWDAVGLIVATLALLISASSYYYLKVARKNSKTYTDLSILSQVKPTDQHDRDELDK